jgi:hypothetical protein
VLATIISPVGFTPNLFHARVLKHLCYRNPLKWYIHLRNHRSFPVSEKFSYGSWFISCHTVRFRCSLNNFETSLHLQLAIKFICSHINTRLCGLVVRVPGYRSRGPGFYSRHYQISWEVVGLERGPLSLVRIIEELLEWKSSGSGQGNRINGGGDPLRWPRDTLYPKKLALTSPTSGGRSACMYV